MIVVRFGSEDLLRTRFAISPLFELMRSVAALREPGAHAMHLPWARRVRPLVAGLDLEPLQALVPERGYAPDFVCPPPASPLPDVAEELQRVRRTPAEQVIRELDWRFADEPPPRALRALRADPEREINELVDLMADYWQIALEPDWPRIRATVEADVLRRARLLTSHGPLAVFGDLHPRVRWADDALWIEQAHDAEIELDGRGLLLVPAAFGWPEIFAMTDPPWQPALLYAPTGVATLWEPDTVGVPGADIAPDAGATLGALVGRRRALVLLALTDPATTSNLARRLDLSPATVSEHLGVLRRSGLVESRRSGRSVISRRTELGDALVNRPDPGDSRPHPPPGTPMADPPF